MAVSRLEQIEKVVRAYMRDYPGLNRLIKGVETSPRTVHLCIYETVEDFNLSSPLPPRTIENFPNTHLLILGTVALVLQSAEFLQARNHLTYSDGQGMQVNESDHMQQYEALVRRLQQEYEQKKDRLIIRLNTRQCMGTAGTGASSDFGTLGDDDYFWRQR